VKLLVIGIGKSGSRIADQFAQLNKKARIERGVSIVTGAYAVSNDRDSLTGLISRETDFLYRLLIGSLPPGAEGTTVDELGMETVQAESDRILSAIRRGEYFETAAFLVVASAWGNFGSTLAPIVGQKLKERYAGKSVYCLLILPAESEESAAPKRIYNAAVCLKSVNKATDAVFLVDNEKLKRDGVLLDETWYQANQEILTPFYDLLCASEVSGSKYAGVRTLGVGDIIQTLAGFTAIGKGKVRIPAVRFFAGRLPTFRDKGVETLKALEALNLALSRLSVDCDPRESGRAMYLLSAPSQEISIDMAMALGNRLRELTNTGEIRGGDLSGEHTAIQVIVTLSELAYIEKVKNYYDKAAAYLKEGKGE